MVSLKHMEQRTSGTECGISQRWDIYISGLRAWREICRLQGPGKPGEEGQELSGAGKATVLAPVIRRQETTLPAPRVLWGAEVRVDLQCPG